MNDKFYIGIDVGGTKIAAILATGDGNILSRAKSPTPEDSTPKKITRIISDLFEEMLLDRNFKKADLCAAGIGIPGIVEAHTGVIIRTPNMKLSGANLKRYLEDKLKINCYLGNDVNLGTLGEKWLGAAQKAKNVIGLFIGTGIGAGVIIDDKLVTGSHGAAAELGHMIIQDDGPKCSCGNVGCLEALAGRRAIERSIKEAISKGEKTIITGLLDKKTGPIKSKVLRKALKNRDRLAEKILKAASQQLGIACVSIRHIFDPEMIVLGGGVIEACGDFMLPIIINIADKDRFFQDIGNCRIVASKLGDDAIVLGAIALAKNSLQKLN